jgi:branched-chain amino acid transport system ATP-binding protein
MLLEIKNLTAQYKAFEALRDINLEIAEGECVTILGANGAGKTTLARALLSTVKITKGEIGFEGARIDGLKNYDIVKRGIAICPEGGSCFPELTVQKNLMLGSILLESKLLIENCYEKVKGLFPILEERKNQTAGLLSGGERKMLAIGRSLMSNPKLLVLDEPSLGIAPKVVSQIFKTISMLRDSGLAILLIEQNAARSLSVAQRGYVLELGKIIISGPSSDLVTNDAVKSAYLGM